MVTGHSYSFGHFSGLYFGTCHILVLHATAIDLEPVLGHDGDTTIVLEISIGYILEPGHPVGCGVSNTVTCFGFPVPALFWYCSGTKDTAIVSVFPTKSPAILVLFRIRSC